jgi:hypothetical protein
MFIFIGGSSRSGTNSVSVFLHLHDDVTTLRTMRQVNQYTEQDLRERCANVVFGSKYNCLTTCLIREEVEYNPWTDFVRAKNERIWKSGKFTKHVGLRWDHCEWACSATQKSVQAGEAKLVFAMRDLKKIFTSLVYNGFGYKGQDMDRNRRVFEEKIAKSIKAVKKLKGCPVDASRGDDLKRLLDWLGLEPNEMQLEWMKAPPVTNSTIRVEKKKKSVLYPDYVKEFLPTVEISPDLEQQYWALRQ